MGSAVDAHRPGGRIHRNGRGVSADRSNSVVKWNGAESVVQAQGGAVKSFDDLSPRGQRERMRRFGHRALAPYGIDADVDLRFVAASFNTIFRVHQNPRSAALRIGPRQRIHAERTEFVEAAWIRALRADKVAQPPDVIETRDGSPVSSCSMPGVPAERSCMLFEWVPGVTLSKRITVERLRGMGQLSARLHQHGADMPPSVQRSVLVADRVLYWRLENRLHELGPAILEAFDRATASIEALWAAPPSAPQLLHGDLTPHNVMVDGDRLIPIDFQDAVWGLDVQDLALSMVSLGQVDSSGDLGAAFRLGYESVRPWPDLSPDLLATLCAARRLHQLNLSLTLRKPGLDVFVARMEGLIERWLRTPA